MQDVLTLASTGTAEIAGLLRRYGLVLEQLPAGSSIDGSYWGESEAGLVGSRVLVRPDTPLHSVLHEACHYVCMTPQRRNGLHTDAGGDDLEECGVCYLQILLADWLPALGRERMLADMDAWGYSFRLGSARSWFERDAEDGHGWLLAHELITPDGQPTWRTREE